MSELKSGWKTVSISQIADHCLGKMLDKQKNKGEFKPYLRNLNVRWFYFDLSDVLEMRFEKEEAARYQAQSGDLIICEGGYPGRAAVWDSDEPIYLQKALHRVRFFEPTHAKWVLYWLYLKDIDGTLADAFSGAGIQHFTKAALARFKVPLAPLDEQKRIVAILDQGFAAIACACALAEANLADALKLFEAAVDTLLSSSRDGWHTGQFQNMVGKVSTGPFGSLMHKSDYIEGGTPVINPSNIVDGNIVPDWMKSVSAEAASRLVSYKLCAGDVVIGRRGEMGRCAPVLPHMEGWLCGTGSFIIRTKPDVSSEFVGYLMRTPAMVAVLTSIATGATMFNLSNRAIAEMSIELPVYSEQLILLNRIKSLEGNAKLLRSNLEAKLADLANLRQSLLQKAFSGQLT